jgi:hypothetical protein
MTILDEYDHSYISRSRVDIGMPTTGTPVPTSLATFELALYGRMTISTPLPTMVPFVAKVHRVRTRRGKDYSVLRMTLPKDVGEKIGVTGNDYLFALAQKAEWYHMIDWSQMTEAWSLVPPEMKAVLVHYGLVPQGSTVGPQEMNIPVISATRAALPASSP